MKTIYLSNSNSRVFCVIGDVVLTAIVGAMFYFVHSKALSLIVAILLSALLLVLLVFYTLITFKSKVVIDKDAQTLTLCLLRSISYDVKDVKYVCTRATQVGQKTTRILVFQDANNAELFTIATFITADKGVMNEPLAENVAYAIGAQFVPSVDKCEYDKQARAERDQALKEERRRLRLQRKQEREAKRRGVSYVAPEQSTPTVQPPVLNQVPKEQINYDELDDQTIISEKKKG